MALNSLEKKEKVVMGISKEVKANRLASKSGSKMYLKGTGLKITRSREANPPKKGKTLVPISPASARENQIDIRGNREER